MHLVLQIITAIRIVYIVIKYHFSGCSIIAIVFPIGIQFLIFAIHEVDLLNWNNIKAIIARMIMYGNSSTSWMLPDLML